MANIKNDEAIRDAEKNAKRPHNGPNDVPAKEWTSPFAAVQRATAQAKKKKEVPTGFLRLLIQTVTPTLAVITEATSDNTRLFTCGLLTEMKAVSMSRSECLVS